MRRIFAQLREQVGETRFLEEMELAVYRILGSSSRPARRWPVIGVWRGWPRNRRLA